LYFIIFIFFRFSSVPPLNVVSRVERPKEI
jgi:hypothetical protein